MAHIKPQKAKPASPQIIVPNKEIWQPSMFPKQLAYFNDTTRFRLAAGPRYCGKSRAVHHTILKHAWNTKNGRIAIFTKSVRNAKVGVWSDLTSHIWDEWKSSGLRSPYGGFDWVKEPGCDGATRMHYFKMRNYYGLVSEIQLHSLDYDGDVASKLMNSSFSMIYFSELQHFELVDVFKISILQLRTEGLPYEKHLWASDTNPPDSGTDHFAYDLWYRLRTQEDPPESCKTPEEIKNFRRYQSQFGLHEFQIDDNVLGAKEMISDLKATYEGDVVGWNRFILGRWEKAYSTKEYWFRAHFKRDLHVVGNCSAANKKDWQILIPTKEVTTLLTSWDIGSVNHAFTIEEPMVMENDAVGFGQLDENLWLGVQESVVDFVTECLEKMEDIEKLVGHEVTWRSWSDSSAFMFSGKNENIDAMLVEKISGGKVMLLSAGRAKQRNSIRHRIKLLQDMLDQGREMVSAHCIHTIAMYENLRSARGGLEPIAKGSPEKHLFDCKSYLRWCELYAEVMDGPKRPNLGQPLISIML